MPHDSISVVEEEEVHAVIAADKFPPSPVASEVATEYFETIHSHPKIMTLDVGGGKLKVGRQTLESQSGLLKTQLSEGYAWTPQADGSYFLDADPEIFEHLLRFMRRPEVYPLFYNRNRGFDFKLYNRLEREADYFQVEPLEEWIKNKMYKEAIIIETSEPIRRDLKDVGSVMSSGMQDVEQHLLAKTKKVYIYPRRILVHRGLPDRCGAACAKARADKPDEFEEEDYTEIVIIRKTVRFLAKACRAAI